MTRVPVTFVGGDAGGWAIARIEAVKGAGLAAAPRLAILEGRTDPSPLPAAQWTLHGVTSHDRYLTAAERSELRAVEEMLGRSAATRAALIPIRKSEAWWDLAQDQRRAIFEERSRHIATGLDYLPAVARRLHHGRELGAEFDFLTWFEFAPEVSSAFDELVARLRATEEWTYVEREVDIRVVRDSRV